MSLVKDVKDNLNESVSKIAKANIRRKLAKQGIDPEELDPKVYNELVQAEITILESDTKKIAAGVGVGLLISALTGF